MIDNKNTQNKSGYNLETRLAKMETRKTAGRKQAIPAHEQVRIVALYHSGEYTLKALANAYEVSTETIRRCLARVGDVADSNE